MANAIQRVSLFEETTHYAEQLETVNAMGHALAETLDLLGIYEMAARSALNLLPDTARVIISLFNPQANLITPVYGLQNGGLIKVAALPSHPFDESGKDNLSDVILRAGSLIVSDLNEVVKDLQAVEAKDELAQADGLTPLRSALYLSLIHI